MEYGGYDIFEADGGIVVEKVRDFNPVHTFECGQCFRWARNSDGSYTVVAFGKVVTICAEGEKVTITGADLDDFKYLWFEYLDLGRDYSGIKEKIRKDDVMDRAVSFGSGIRILRQNFREMLVSFIISANNAIPRIMQTVQSISEMYGDRIPVKSGYQYAFPPFERLSVCSLDNLRECKGGFRCKYIIEAARMVQSGAVDIAGLASMPQEQARLELMRLPGVGPKVADCILLYSGTRYDVFPTDVWVKRVMEELYFHREANFREIRKFAAEYFGEYAGFAQQYLFYYARENRIGA